MAWILIFINSRLVCSTFQCCPLWNRKQATLLVFYALFQGNMLQHSYTSVDRKHFDRHNAIFCFCSKSWLCRFHLACSSFSRRTSARCNFFTLLFSLKAPFAQGNFCLSHYQFWREYSYASIQTFCALLRCKNHADCLEISTEIVCQYNSPNCFFPL